MNGICAALWALEKKNLHYTGSWLNLQQSGEQVDVVLPRHRENVRFEDREGGGGWRQDLFE